MVAALQRAGSEVGADSSHDEGFGREDSFVEDHGKATLDNSRLLKLWT